MTGDVPQGLETREQWICWRNECRDCGRVIEPEVKICPDCDEKTTKRPVDPQSGGFAKVSDPSTWGGFGEAKNFNESHDTHGVGFVFTEDDDLVAVDLDDCRDPETGALEDWAVDIVATINGYTEVSPSGTGLHIYVYGELPEGRSRKDGVEMYEADRYMTISGEKTPHSTSDLTHRTDELKTVHEGYVEDEAEGASEDITVDIDVPTGDLEDETFENDLGQSLEEIRERDDKVDAALREMEPGYEINDKSPSGYDASTVSNLWFWRFSPEQIAKILLKYRSRPKLFKHPSYLELTIEFGIGGEQYDPRPEVGEEVEILEDRNDYESIEDVDFPDHGDFVLDKPPREGGSHASIDHLSMRPLVVLASRHAICEHHLEILDKVMPEGDTAVHYTGSHRACEHGGGDSCPRYVSGENYQELYNLENEAKEVVHNNRIVTADDTPDQYCRAQFISKAEKFAETVVTVPHLLENLESGFDGRNLLIDEEQALGYFRPNSAELLTVKQSFDTDGTRRIQTGSTPISDQFNTLEKVREDIFDEWQRRREDAEERGGHWNKNPWEKDILNAITYLDAVREALGVTDIVENLDDGFSYNDVLDALFERASAIDPPEPKTNPDNFREKLKDYTERYFYDDSSSPGEMIEAALFQYEDKPFDFKNAGDGHKLRLIAGRQVFHKDSLSQFEQIGVIAGPEGELLFDDLGLPATVINITDFKYDDDFVIVPIGRETGDGMESVPKQRGRARRVSKILNSRSHPHLAVAGTKGRAREHHSTLSDGNADIISSPDKPSLDIFATWTVGGTGIIYENSAVSRGIDAPPFDISVVVSSGFATPYWEARKKFYQGDDREEYQYAKNIESQLKSHELTNAVLRPAPTRTVDDKTGTTFVVCADWDAPRLRYLNQSTDTIGNVERAANFVQNLTVQGGIREEYESVYEQVGQNESDFIEVAMETGFKERLSERPTYDADVIGSWPSNNYCVYEDEPQEVLDAVPVGGEVPFNFITDTVFTGWSNGRLKSNVTVLRKQGYVKMRKEYPDGGGRPKRFVERE